MAVYQDKARERIKRSLRKFQRVVERAREAGANEADTRTIVTAFLTEALGWDAFQDVTGEHRIKGNYADFAIRNGRDMLAIIEVKSVGTTLGPKHLYQAVSYAADEGVDWDLFAKLRLRTLGGPKPLLRQTLLALPDPSRHSHTTVRGRLIDGRLPLTVGAADPGCSLA